MSAGSGTSEGTSAISLSMNDRRTLPTASWLAWGAIAYGGIAVTVVSYAMWYPLVRRYPVNQTMPFTLLIPLFAVASSALILGDELTVQTAIGGGATILGVAVIVLRPWRA